jgi:hypothetical protein
MKPMYAQGSLVKVETYFLINPNFPFMTSQSERSFGARLRKLQDAIEYIKTWKDYSPPRIEETVPQLLALTGSIVAGNQQETITQTTYQSAVDIRQKLFTGDESSIKRLLVQIRGTVESQYGKSSNQVKQVATVVTQLRKSKLIKLPADPANPEKEKTVSQSQRSYGSQTQLFTELVITLQQFGDYSTTNTVLSLDSLQQLLTRITETNNTVAACLQQMRNTRAERTLFYKELFDRMRRIKAYTRSKYGLASQEYKSLTALGDLST